MKSLIAVAALSLAGCSSTTVYEAAIGYNATAQMPWSQNSDGGFDGPRDTVRFTVRQESINGRYFCGYSHISHLSAGWPFNNDDEDWLDIIEAGVRFQSRR